MAMGPLDETTVRLIPGRLFMNQEVDMPIFQITDWNLDQKSFRDVKQGISMRVVLKRKITSEMMTTFFPSLLLTAITFATTFFKPFFFEAALSVNLTTMLVMTTIFISKMEGLPPTSDIKMIDIWLVLCQMVPFAEVILLTAMEYHREEISDEVNKDIFDVTPFSDEDQNMEAEEDVNKCNIKMLWLWLPRLKTIGWFFIN